LRVLGDAGAFVVRSLDGQEASLRAGVRPDDPGFGVEPPEEWGRVLRGDEGEAVSSERGRWASFYTGVAHLLRGGGPSPVDPADAVDVLTVLEAARRSARQGSVVALRAV
jgi:predicted dehydrogenase